MAPYNFNMNDVMFETNKIIHIVDLDPLNPGLYRQNAMTVYEHITPFMIEAKCIESNTKLFYLVYCRHHGWVRINEEIHDYIMNHKSVKPSVPTSKRKFKKLLLITPIILMTSLTFYKKFNNK